MSAVKRWIHKLASLYEQTDARRHVRIPADFDATLSNDTIGTLYVTGVDANRDGAGVQSTTPLDIGTLVFLKIPGLAVMGFAHVKHCSPRNNGYLLGLEFRERLVRDPDVVGGPSFYKLVRHDARRLWDDADVS
jgi:hypothetical protein